jgi:predicted transposase/invertase (TIGR01784 family)
MMSQPRYLDVTNDVAFKKVFEHKEILKDFLNVILRRPKGLRIVELEFIPSEEIPDLGQGKRSMFDLKCTDESGKVYVVEMQNRREPHFLKRVQYYASHAYVSQLQVGNWHKNLMPVIVVAITKSNYFPKEVKCISYHRTREDETNQLHLYELTYVFIELKKFTKKKEELRDLEDYWLYFLAKSQNDKAPPKEIKDKMILQAYQTLEQFNWTKAEYDAYIRARLLAEADILTLEKSYEDGEKKGIGKGIEKGRAERDTEIAINLLAQGISIKVIAKSTGLTLKQIEELKKKMNEEK